MTNKWNLHELLDREQGVISTFVDGKNCSKKAEARFDRTLDHLTQLDKQQWSRPHASPLTNHIYVIRFTDENRRQLRVFGHFYEAHHCFVMTLSGDEKDDKYSPPDYLKRSIEHKELISKEFATRTAAYGERCAHDGC